MGDMQTSSCGTATRGMSALPVLNRECFQTLLADAFAVQESGIDTQSLHALVEIHRMVETDQLDVNRAMHLIAECSRDVAQATGIAIARVEADQLVYWAGSGTAVSYVGRHLTAVLSVSAHNRARREILCVENAETDARIEAAICRQFGAKSLLILPIYRRDLLVGVLQVFFCDAHTFGDREMRTYRLLAELAGEMICREPKTVKERHLGIQSTAAVLAVPGTPFPLREFRIRTGSAPGPANTPWKSSHGQSSSGLAVELPTLRPANLLTIKAKLAERIFRQTPRRNVVAAAVVITFLGVILSFDHHFTFPSNDTGPRWSKHATVPISTVLSKPSADHPLQEPVTTGGVVGTQSSSAQLKGALTGRVRVNPVADDVITRHYTRAPSLTRSPTTSTVVSIGEDVTVRYFASKPGIAPVKPSASAALRQGDIPSRGVK